MVVPTDGERGRDLEVDSEEVLVPQDIDCRQVQDQAELVVQKGLWKVIYSWEDSGWRLTFTEFATQIEGWNFSAVVCEQLEEATDVSASVQQLAGVDGGIFECTGSFGLESRNSVVFEGNLISGEIDDSMAVFVPVNAVASKRLELESIEFVDRAAQHESGLGLICVCDDLDQMQLLLDLDVAGQLFEVSRRAVSPIVDQMHVVRELVQPYRSLVEEISSVLFHHDPIDINYDDNTDEYDPEAETIVLRFLDIADLTQSRVLEVVHEEFVRWFGVDSAGPVDDYEDIAREVKNLADLAQLKGGDQECYGP